MLAMTVAENGAGIAGIAAAHALGLHTVEAMATPMTPEMEAISSI